MWIDVKIPYEPGHKLSYAYNRAMEETSAPWVLLLDQDVYISLNPHWYDMCLDAIRQVEGDAGLITCVMNGCEGRPQEPDCSITKSPSIEDHREKAHEVYMKNDNSLRRIQSKLVAGYFMLVNRVAWEEVKFEAKKGKPYKVDHWFVERLMKNEFGVYLMPGLYVYHERGVRKLNWNK